MSDHTAWVLPWALFLAAVALGDGLQRRIPNRLLLGTVIVLAVLYATGAGRLPWGTGIVPGLLGAAMALAALLVFYATGLMGAGDVKFAAVLGLALGWRPLLTIWAAASVLAGLHALLIVATRNTAWWAWLAPLLAGRRPAPAAPQQGQGARQPRLRPVPYGSYLAVAALALGPPLAALPAG
ncbi:A24 family peptidase [Xylophilus sp.]|uniref:A24 family peptidase n=1 Tax=Xylophilus sp. TaxID=2653893 RepID=UPI002D80BA72|nr:A24 family peptidase [Xylophilus sp.]